MEPARALAPVAEGSGAEPGSRASERTDAAVGSGGWSGADGASLGGFVGGWSSAKRGRPGLQGGPTERHVGERRRPASALCLLDSLAKDLFPLLLRPHLGLLPLAHLVLPRAVSGLLTQLALVLTLEGAALLTHALIEAAFLGLLPLDRPARRSAHPWHEPRPLRPHSGNPRAVGFDGASLDRNVLPLGGRTRIHDLITLESAARGALEDLGTEPSLRRQRVVHFVAGHIARSRNQSDIAAGR